MVRLRLGGLWRGTRGAASGFTFAAQRATAAPAASAVRAWDSSPAESPHPLSQAFIWHQSPKCRGAREQGWGQALFPPDWLDRSQGASGVPREEAAWGWRVPRAPCEPRDGPTHPTKASQGCFKPKIQVSKRRGLLSERRHQRVCRRCKSCAAVTHVLPRRRLGSPHTGSVAGQSFSHRKIRMLLLPEGSSVVGPGHCRGFPGVAMAARAGTWCSPGSFAGHPANAQALQTQGSFRARKSEGVFAVTVGKQSLSPERSPGERTEPPHCPRRLGARSARWQPVLYQVKYFPPPPHYF